jgi:hypothetical protein
VETKMTLNLNTLERVQGLDPPGTNVEPPAVATPVVLATPQDIRAGSVLVKSDVVLPDSVSLACKRYGAWKLVTETDGVGFDRMVSEAGWHFFFMVPEIRVGALSVNRNNAIRLALKKALAAVEGQNLNALEIVNISVKRVLGLYHVRFVVHPRQLKQSPYLRDHSPYHVSRNVWNGKGVYKRRAQIGAMRKGI